MTRLTAQEIEAIRKRAEKATVGDWYSEISTFENATEKLTEIAVQPGVAMHVRTEADAEFIANAREDIPKLLAEVEALRSGIKTAIDGTSCDDTWDYLNRLLDGKPPLNLPYRIGGDA